jgi:hypothetical protein
MFKEITKAKNKSDILKEFLYFVLNILIVTFILRIAWNRALVPHISTLKPIKTMLDAFFLSLSINIIKSV